MELEEAIKRVKDLIEDNKQYFEKTLNKDDADIQDRLKKDNEALETVLNELDNLKFKYQARKDRTDTIIKKQEKMIELMAEHISFEKDIQKILCSPKVHKEGACTCITCKRCIKQYFENKSEESE